MAINVEFSEAEAKELISGMQGTAFATKLQSALDTEATAAIRRQEAKRESRQRTNQNKKARTIEMREKAAAYEKAVAEGRL